MKKSTHINFDLNESMQGLPWGGGASFLATLKRELLRQDLYEEDIIKANVVLLNSHHNMKNIWKIKKINTKAIFPHRVDGPMKLWRGENDETDNMVYYYANLYADGLIFQSKYSHFENIKNGFKVNKPYCIIYNATDDNLFHPPKNKVKNEKIRIIASSWSDNPLKGYSTYKFLDDNLNFDKYEMIFAGRSPIEFKNIKNAGTLNKLALSTLLKTGDMFISASSFDPCSNSAIESLSCGLPVVYRESGGHAELVKNGGIGFTYEDNLLQIIDDLADNIEKYKNNIKIENIRQVAKKYIDFFDMLLKRKIK